MGVGPLWPEHYEMSEGEAGSEVGHCCHRVLRTLSLPSPSPWSLRYPESDSKTVIMTNGSSFQMVNYKIFNISGYYWN